MPKDENAIYHSLLNFIIKCNKCKNESCEVSIIIGLQDWFRVHIICLSCGNEEQI